ncbi:MAG TPA: helix-turn-helix domain-containing protein [Myxococcota bacterium]|nr:helix-turn-helix domain-containing protein [Myxococcota bacterium]
MDLVTEQMLERRERILAAVRELVAERGWRAVTMRDLARRCRVSVPTLYNQFGGKDELLATAALGPFRELLELTVREQAPSGWRRVLALVERCAENMTNQSSYHRALLEAFAVARETGPVRERFVSSLTRALAEELAEMRRLGQLQAWADAELLAGQITASCVSASVRWSQGGLGDSGLRAAMLHAASLLLLGVALGEARSGVESSARAAQAELAEPVVASPRRRPRRAALRRAT